ncbi:hypothetical protein Tco_0313436 [Tanacetum coccineum]
MVFNSHVSQTIEWLSIHLDMPLFGKTKGFASLEQWYRIFKYSSQDSSRLDVAAKFIFQSSRYVVPTGRVVVPTGRYVVPAGKVIIIVSPGRLSLVPTGRVLSPGRVK